MSLTCFFEKNIFSGLYKQQIHEVEVEVEKTQIKPKIQMLKWKTIFKCSLGL